MTDKLSTLPRICLIRHRETAWSLCGQQTRIIHIIRTAKVPFLESRASPALIATSLIVAAVGVILPFTWLGGTLGFVPLPPGYWLQLCLILLGYAVLTHLMKTWFSRRFGLV